MPTAANPSSPTSVSDGAADAVNFALPEQLPHDADALRRLVREQQAALDAIRSVITESEQRAQSERERALSAQQRAKDAEQRTQDAERHIQYLHEQIILLRRRMFGTRSEQQDGQAWLFDEAEALAAQPEPEVADEPDKANTPPTGAQPRRRGKRRALPPELPRVDIVHDLDEAKRVCPCGCQMVPIGQEVSEQLDIVPMQIRVLRHIRLRYGCADKTHAPATAPLPAQPLPKSNASAGLLAMLLTTKYVDGMPLARFEKVLDRHGVRIPRQTLARYAINTTPLIQPVFNLLRDELFDGPYVHMDETRVQVLKEPGRTAQSDSQMWVQRGGPPGRPVVLFDYSPSRGGEVAKDLLAGYRGFLMTDGYTGYNAVAGTDGIEHMCCMAHARREFVDAKATQPKGKVGRADHAIKLFAKLYRIERKLKDASDSERFLARRAQSLPVLKELRQWLTKTLPVVTPKSALGKALGYLNKYWDKLTRYIEWGYLPIDNNPAENAIRPFVVGRRGWLFADTPAGANASAMIYSLVETANANGVEPYTWLRHLLTELPGATTVEQIQALLPWNIHPATLTGNPTT